MQLGSTEMRRETRRRERRPIAALLATLLLLVPPTVALAQADEAKPPAEEQKPAEPEPVLASEIAGLARGIEAKLETLAAFAEPSPEVNELRAALPALEEKLNADALKTRERIESTENLTALKDQVARWATETADLEAKNAIVTDRARQVATALEELRQVEAEWRRRLEETAKERVPEVVRLRIRDVLAAGATAEKKLVAAQRGLLELQDRIEGSLRLADGIRADLDVAMERSRSAVLGATAPPIWQIAFDVSQEESPVDRIRSGVDEEVAVVVDYLTRRRDPVVVVGVGTLALYAFLVFLRPRARARREGESDPDPSLVLLERPLAGALVGGLLFVPLVDISVPRAVSSLAGLIALPAIVALVWPLMTRRTRPVLYGIVVFVFLDRTRDVLQGLPQIERLLFTLELVAAIAFLAWLIRTGRIIELPRSPGWRRVVEVVQPLVLVLLVLALLASTTGWVQLGALLGGASLRSSYGAFAIWVLFQLGGAILLVSMGSRAARRLRVVRSRGKELLRGTRIALQTLGFLLWLDRALTLYAVGEPVRSGLSTALTTRFEAGALSVSLGGVLSFIVAVVVSVYLSRFVQFVLEEEVMPRVTLPRGVPYAISTSARYAVITLGFLAAVSAAGLDLSSLAFVAGALSVGIGFGLQNVVSNFVSGLILLFERPIQTGDTITVGEVMGEVRRIGIRASIVRDFDGAEVLVPNANLLSEMVVNWTLSDRRRRMEIMVGVAYGTDPRMVLELLRGVVDSEERLLKEPEPAVQFLDFGESSLDFRVRAWTDDFDNFWDLRSAIIVDINQALSAAGIEIPFPQRDLHVRSIDPGIGLPVGRDA